MSMRGESALALVKSTFGLLSPAGATPWQRFTNIIVIYFVFSRLLKVQRHLRARGVVQTVHDFYRWALQVSGAVQHQCHSSECVIGEDTAS